MPAPPPKEEVIEDDLIGPIYYEGEEEPQPEDLTPVPIEDDKFEDNVEVGYYDEKTVKKARDEANTAQSKVAKKIFKPEKEVNESLD